VAAWSACGGGAGSEPDGVVVVEVPAGGAAAGDGIRFLAGLDGAGALAATGTGVGVVGLEAEAAGAEAEVAVWTGAGAGAGFFVDAGFGFVAATVATLTGPAT
jgi:hypothetical protein